MSQVRIGAAFSSIETSSLSDISDVLITSPQDNDLLAYDSASSSWINQTATQAGLDSRYLQIANNLSDLNNVVTARTNLGLGSMAVQNANNVAITGGSIVGITDLAIADGGTGASTAADARTNLGLTAGGAGDIWVEKAGDAMTGPLTITTTNLTTGPLIIDVDQTNGGTSSQFIMSVYTTAQAPAFIFQRALNTLSVPQTLTTGQRVLTMSQNGYNGTGAFQTTTQILFEVDGTSGNTLGGRIRMYTADTAGTITEALRINDDQQVTLNASTATLTIGSSTPSSTEVVSSAITFTNTTGTRKTFDASGTTWAPTGNASGQLQAVNAEATIDTTASGFNFTNSIGGLGFQGKVTVNGTGGTVTGVRGGNFIVTNAGSATITTAITSAFLATSNSGGGAVTSCIGVMIADQTVGGTNNTNLLVGSTSTPSGSYNIYAPSTKDNYFGGNTGIGITPSVRFHVYEGVDGDAISRFQNPSTGTSARVFLQFTNNTPASGYLMVTGSNYTGIAGWGDRYIFNSDVALTGGILMRPGAGGFQVSAGDTNDPDLYVENSTGDVGIGTTSPVSDLHIIRAGATFTVEASSGAVNATVIASAGNANMIFDSPAGSQSQLNFNSSELGRWLFVKTSTAESGSNAGSNFNLLRRTDAGGSLGNPVLTFERSTGRIGVNMAEATATAQLHVTGDVKITTDLTVDTTTLFVDSTANRVGIGTINPQQLLDVRGIIYSLRYANQGTIRCARANGTEASPTAVAAADNVGQISFDGTYSAANLFASGADILATASGNWTTTTNTPTEVIFRTSTGGGLVEKMAINATEFVHNDTGIDYDFRVEGDTQANLLMVVASTDRVGINVAAPTGKLHIDQSSTTAAIPVLILDQADVSEEFIELVTTIGTGNALEAVGAKTLTTTHFMKYKIPGGLIRYAPLGTIA